MRAVVKTERGTNPQLRVKKLEPNFLSKLGNPRFIAAPMVQQSDLAFRLLVRRHGCELAFTQMLHSRNFVKSAKFRQQNWDPLITPAPLPCQGEEGERGLVNEEVGALLAEHQQQQQQGAPSKSSSSLPPPPPPWFPPLFDRPLIAQFAGDDPRVLVEAARFVEDEGVDGIDLNLGE